MIIRMISVRGLAHDRFAHMLLLLVWEGRLNRARLREIFDLSEVRASEWIREFRDRNPDLTEWDPRSRSFRALPSLYRRKPSAFIDTADSLARYLSLTGLTVTSPSNSDTRQAIYSGFPELATPSPLVFATLTESIRTRHAVQIKYRSMRDPSPHKRIIAPHSIVRAGGRWHVRAFSETHGDFRDYALGRIAEVTILSRDDLPSMEADEAWLTPVRVRLIPHPNLTQEQQAIIRFEYFREAASRVEVCRGPLVAYFIQDARAATRISTQRPPEYQLAVENLPDVEKWLWTR